MTKRRPRPIENLFPHYGGNKPCPCGSRKKFKACCRASHRQIAYSIRIDKEGNQVLKAGYPVFDRVPEVPVLGS